LLSGGVRAAVAPLHAPGDLAEQPRASMPAHVRERAELVVLAADHDDALVGDVVGEVVAGVRELLLAADAVPAPGEDTRLLDLPDLRIVVIATGQPGVDLPLRGELDVLEHRRFLPGRLDRAGAGEHSPCALRESSRRRGRPLRLRSEFRCG